jgi:hypothetical protein
VGIAQTLVMVAVGRAAAWRSRAGGTHPRLLARLWHQGRAAAWRSGRRLWAGSSAGVVCAYVEQVGAALADVRVKPGLWHRANARVVPGWKSRAGSSDGRWRPSGQVGGHWAAG